ncbi:MAG TPA: PEP-CTERM-box response regulator transcription factor [Candidatus Paceibacterota bacterium]|nr:PEP-CTERM-box response regulator transcription factor [Verrucomicrobiota bacterium]HRY46598.1 PEP-CTERM-box response regulator transcription factor [Candidatus Paceibacterota bacterium]
MKPELLIIDDDEEIRSQMKWALVDDYSIHMAGDRASALEQFQSKQPAVILLDLGLPPHPASPEEGLAILSELTSLDRRVKVIVITGQNEKEVALKAVDQGAYDFLCKPLQLDELKILLKRSYRMTSLERENEELRERLQSKGFEDMLGACPQIQGLYASIRKVATTDASVLIIGESGTGKEMAAVAIHRSSPRKEGPFIAINCGAIPENLLESELFGHEKGSFTGAHTQRMGRLEMASGGVVFLDEIGEMSLPLQVKLLRFLQERKIERVGGRSLISVDVRVLAASNKNLLEAVQQGQFREDLYYRLAVVVLKLPPLRERGSDLELLSRAFLSRFSKELGRGSLKLSPEAIDAIRHHSWPGNIRELQNRLRRAVIMAEDSRITPEDLELGAAPIMARNLPLKDAREAVEREMVLQALRNNDGKISRAAAELGISRPTFYELMEKLGIKKEVDTVPE